MADHEDTPDALVAADRPYQIGKSHRKVDAMERMRGVTRYTDDLKLPGMLHGKIKRSPHAHARIKGIDAAAAKSAPGVVAVFVGEDMAADNLGGLPCGWGVKNKDGSPMAEPPHPVLAVGKVRHVGDPVAVVIAETKGAARDAAELVSVDYDVLPAVPTLEAAQKPGAALVHDGVAGNICYDWHLGDKDATDAAFACPLP